MHPHPTMYAAFDKALRALRRRNSRGRKTSGTPHHQRSFAKKRTLGTGPQLTGREVVVLAPQRQQVMDMEAAGFPSPRTVT